MTHSTPILENTAVTGGFGRCLDFVELTKPRIVFMVVLTTLVGFYLAAETIPGYLLLLSTLAGTALAAGGTLALNEFMEREVDALMDRTRHRPLPAGRVQPGEALIFGMALAASGLLVLVFAVNLLSGCLAGMIIGSYLFIYTPLKQKSWLSGLFGAIPGALPPVIGWTAAQEALGPGAWVLFGILFFWQVPHTLAIGRLYRHDFAKAGIQFLSVIDLDGAATGRQAISHALALVAVSLLPAMLGLAGLYYFLAALVLGGAFLSCNIALAVSRSLRDARRLLIASLIYLPLLLAVLALDRAGLW